MTSLKSIVNTRIENKIIKIIFFKSHKSRTQNDQIDDRDFISNRSRQSIDISRNKLNNTNSSHVNRRRKKKNFFREKKKKKKKIARISFFILV